MSCRECFQGHRHEGELTGTITKLYGLDVYVAEPPEGTEIKGVIVIIPDAFGWEMHNNRLLADRYAARSCYRVYLPDFMNGSGIPGFMLPVFRTLYSKETGILAKIPAFLSVMYNAVPFFIKNRFGVMTPKVIAFMKALKKNEASTLPLGAAGFCWGGKVVFQLCADKLETRVDGRPLLGAGFTGHPSALDLPADGVAVKIPLSVAIGDKDIFLSEVGALALKKELENRPEPTGPDGKAKGVLRLYPGVGHGFCVRGDVNVPDNKGAADQAEEQALEWFKKHLGG